MRGAVGSLLVLEIRRRWFKSNRTDQILIDSLMKSFILVLSVPNNKYNEEQYKELTDLTNLNYVH